MLIKQTYSRCVTKLVRRSYCCASGDVYDVVVSGGGMVGMAAAAALGAHPVLSSKSVLLLESSRKTEWQPTGCYGNRVSTLSPQSKSLLQEVGAWTHIASVRHQPVKRMHVWESCSHASIQFDQSEVDEEGNLAYVVENDATVSGFTAAIEKLDSVSISYKTTASQYKFPEAAGDPVSVTLGDGRTIHTRLLIGADGFNSLARKSAGVTCKSWPYEQVGVVATLHLDPQQGDAGNHTAWQRFLSTGPIALLPLSSSQSSLVWSTTPEHGRHLLSLSPEDFVSALNKALTDTDDIDERVAPLLSGYSSLLNRITPSSPVGQFSVRITDIDKASRAMFPYGCMHSEHYVRPRLALVGDACHRIHPLAGQGVNLGFGDVECLIRKLSAAASIGQDIGCMDQLLEYETERQRHVVSVMAACDGLYRLYTTTSPLAVLARSLGLMTVNACSPIKNFFTLRAQSG